MHQVIIHYYVDQAPQMEPIIKAIMTGSNPNSIQVQVAKIYSPSGENKDVYK